MIGLLSAGVVVALYVAGRVHTGEPGLQPAWAPVPRREVAEGSAGHRRARGSGRPGAAGAVDVPEAAACWLAPRAVRPAHRVLGFGLFALTIPIALHCLIAYGVQLTSARVAVHSLAGCFLYGAFVAKVLLVHTRRLPRWVLPVAGGMLAVTVAVLWYSSALWYYNGYQLPHL